MKKLKRWWCHLFHADISRPLGEYYLCWTCLRRYYVPWKKKSVPRVRNIRRNATPISAHTRAARLQSIKSYLTGTNS